MNVLIFCERTQDVTGFPNIYCSICKGKAAKCLEKVKTLNQTPILEDEWLRFIEVAKKPKTNVYGVISKCSGDSLGTIQWYPAWRHYCFFPARNVDAVHSDRCLMAISQFITKLNEEHNTKRRETIVSGNSGLQKDVK